MWINPCINLLKVRALVGLCKLGSSGGSDATWRPFSDGSVMKLAEACRRWLSKRKNLVLIDWLMKMCSSLADFLSILLKTKTCVNGLSKDYLTWRWMLKSRRNWSKIEWLYRLSSMLPRWLVDRVLVLIVILTTHFSCCHLARRFISDIRCGIDAGQSMQCLRQTGNHSWNDWTGQICQAPHPRRARAGRSWFRHQTRHRNDSWTTFHVYYSVDDCYSSFSYFSYRYFS